MLLKLCVFTCGVAPATWLFSGTNTDGAWSFASEHYNGHHPSQTTRHKAETTINETSVVFQVLRVVKMQMLVIWVDLLVDLSVSEKHTAFIFSPEDRGSMFLRDADVYLKVHTTLQSRRSTSWVYDGRGSGGRKRIPTSCGCTQKASRSACP
jgi:hypothetical protein